MVTEVGFEIEERKSKLGCRTPTAAAPNERVLAKRRRASRYLKMSAPALASRSQPFFGWVRKRGCRLFGVSVSGSLSLEARVRDARTKKRLGNADGSSIF